MDKVKNKNIESCFTASNTLSGGFQKSLYLQVSLQQSLSTEVLSP